MLYACVLFYVDTAHHLWGSGHRSPEILKDVFVLSAI